jgi:type III restriction enzyme
MNGTEDFGLSSSALSELRRLFDRSVGVERVWIFGSRARGNSRANSDIDLAIDAPSMRPEDLRRLELALQDLPMLYRRDAVHWQSVDQAVFRAEIERDRKVFWEPRLGAASAEGLGSVSLKRFQSDALDALGRYVDELKRHAAQAENAERALRAMEGMEDLAREASDFPKKTWAALKTRGALPSHFAAQPHSSRFDGAGRAIPNICLKVPTGGGKTLLAAASVGRVFGSYLNRSSGLVLWVVPNEAIYRQTLKALSDRDHPYRQMLNVAGAGRVKVLEKQSPLNRLDVESHLCVMVLMLQSAARQSKETLRFFRDRGNVLGFLPGEDDIEAHWELLGRVPNLDVYTGWGSPAEGARAQKGSIVKSSLGNVMRLLRPMVVIDEGHHAYSENALATLDGFNPSFMLELSATPRVASAKGRGSNILVDVRGTDLDEAEMIKLPIHVDVKRWNSWQSCLAASLAQLDGLQMEAQALQAETARYIRPILLVQVERTGAEQRDSGFIHAEDAKAYLMQLGLSERQIAIKTSDKDELKQPENIDLLSPTCEVRAIVTKQALQEGWDCPFAYVLCALAAGRNPAAMTQLVGRILRLPQVAKTGRAALDACYVLCDDAKTADVVRAIKKSLEGEGMGDLAMAVRVEPGAADATQHVALKRRASLAHLKLYLPKVTWVEPGQARRELVYDSDVLAFVDWNDLNVNALANHWAPNAQGASADRSAMDLAILNRQGVSGQTQWGDALAVLDRARLVRGLIDLAPNAWQVWAWVTAVVQRLLDQNYSEAVLAGSSASLIEHLRIDVEKERDRLAQAVFDRCVGEGRVEFCLRADAADYALPMEGELEFAVPPPPLQRADALSVEKSLLEPAFRTADMNDFEVAFAGYLDQAAALRWWHRNVAKSQYGLQGWKRHKVYPDFVFGMVTHNGQSRTVVMETKGMQLAGSTDTDYKQALLDKLTKAFKDERFGRVGELVLESAEHAEVVCDMVMDQGWRGTLEHRHFAPALTPALSQGERE